MASIFSSAFGNTLLFQGAWYDEATGLYQMGQRNLHPVIGRFLQRDNVVFGQEVQGATPKLLYEEHVNLRWDPTNFPDPHANLMPHRGDRQVDTLTKALQ